MSCSYCGAIHGPGNSNPLCPLASDYQMKVDPLDVIARQKLELVKLRNALDDAVALLRDWEDYDVGDRECMWPKRRDEFLAEHEEDGR